MADMKRTLLISTRDRATAGDDIAEARGYVNGGQNEY